ncbi:MAG: hypothetical protein ACO1QR_05155 [Chthoniobacteraceae bacterium]
MVGLQLDLGMMEREPFAEGLRRDAMLCVKLLAWQSEIRRSIDDSIAPRLSHSVISFTRTPQILTSACFFPFLTATGRALERRAEWLVMNIVPTLTGGYTIFSWDERSGKNPDLFFKSMRSLKRTEIADFLVRLIMETTCPSGEGRG